ncbi:phage tail tape measure C-terminal domain-containing protein [Leisingera sp.]|uniref:phage tail tape measure C-terminal domain-containing protein n=1 Tax=Leisingera sp. TaxID=1879318 RepID=UPI002B2678C6|nr:phage tail tape measure C-terminal domain-containing protein [Leisingera sp.]
MSREKQIAVRFAAVGGNATKAEMRGIGLAGREAMQEIGQSSSIAESGIQHISAAALKARMDLESMATKAMQESMRMRSTIPAESDVQARVMQSTGVTSASGMSASDMLRQGQALDDLRAKLNPLYAEIRRYKQAVAEVRAAELEGAITTEEAAAAKARLRTASLQAIDGIKGISAANREAARAAEEAAMASARQAQQLDDLRARYNPVYAATRQYKAALADLNMLKKQGVISSQEYTDALDREAERMRANIAMNAAGVQQMARSARMGTFRMQQMFYQVNDIGVSLAGGMNPFLVMAQQGTQIAQIYGFGNGGVSGIFRDLSKMVTGVVTRIPFLTAALAVGGVAVAGLRSEINDTGKEVVSFGDTAKAVFQVIGSDIYQFIKPAVDKISDWFSWAWDKVVAGVTWAGNALINGVKISADGIRTYVSTIPDMFQSAFGLAVSYVLTKMHDMVWYVGQAINGIAKSLNETFGTNLSTKALAGITSTLDKASGTYHEMGSSAGARVDDAWENFRTRTEETWDENPMGDFYDRVADQARENARDRKNKKNKGGSEKDDVADLVKELQNQLDVLRETDPIKKKMLEYSEKLSGATDAEKKAVMDLVIELDQAKNGWEAVGLALGDYAEDAQRIGDDIGEAVKGAFSGMEDAIRQFAKTGKLEFRDLIQSFLAELAVLTARKGILGPLADALTGGSGGEDHWLTKAGKFLFNANGNAISNGRVMAFANGGVVDGPTLFPMRDGTGVMGEAGPEGIFPLHRAPDGKLGIRATGSGGGAQQVVVRVILDSEMLNAQITDRSQQVAVSVTKEFGRSALPGMVKGIIKDPRKSNL